jgi:putative membrane protein
MLLELLVAVMLGICGGVITGVTPGLHINLVATVLLSISPFLLPFFPALALAAFIIAMSITHTFTDSIASIYLGAPDSDMVMAILPGHKLLLEGKGYEAVKLATKGGVLCLVVMVALSPLLIFLVPRIYTASQQFIGIGLLIISVFMILRENGLEKKFLALFVFVMAGVLGLFTFALPSLEQPLFPLLSGLFGVSTLMLGLSTRVKIPEQRITEDITIEKGEMVKATAAGVASGGLLSIFPGLGPAQAAILAGQFYKSMSAPIYLVVVGGINTVGMVMSLITLLTIEKARNGSIVVVQELLQSFTLQLFAVSIAVALLSGGIATIVTLWLARKCSTMLNRVNYSAISVGIIVFIAVLAIILDGVPGLFVLGVATSIGMLPVLLNVGRNHAMGVLLLPVMLYFLL